MLSIFIKNIEIFTFLGASSDSSSLSPSPPSISYSSKFKPSAFVSSRLSLVLFKSDETGFDIVMLLLLLKLSLDGL